MNKSDKELVDILKGLDTPSVSDALDKLGLSGQCFGIEPISNYTLPIVGPAFTVKYVPASNPPGTVGDFIEEVAPGDMIVLDNGGRLDCTVWGDIMTEYAGIKKIAGTVIDGVCRDVSKAIHEEYPIFCRGRFMRTGKDRVQVEAINVPVSIGQVRVCARDMVVADASGVVIIPRDQVVRVAEVAKNIETVEAQIRALLGQGKSLKEAREKLNYHHLQRKGI